MLKFDKEKYLRMAKVEGVQAALTQLHKDMEQWEFQTFEGEAGYQPQDWKELHDVREFSRELWELDLPKKA